MEIPNRRPMSLLSALPTVYPAYWRPGLPLPRLERKPAVPGGRSAVKTVPKVAEEKDFGRGDG